MKMKSISIPLELHTWLYAKINSDRKSLYAVIEWLRDCKEHSDRVHTDTAVLADRFAKSFNIVMRWTGDTPPILGDYIGLASEEPGKIQVTDKSKSIGFVIPNIAGLEDDEVCVAVDLDKLTIQVNNVENSY